MIKLNENIYGHKSRLDWIKNKISKDAKGIEFGCGTGVMITAQLHNEGYNIYGLDLDDTSIQLGKSIFSKHQLDPSKIVCMDLKCVQDESLDYIIASEVLEHIPNEELDQVMSLLFNKLNNNGTLLVTIPNGYGCFEIENFLWSRLKVGNIITSVKINSAFNRFKSLFIGQYVDCIYPSSIADSPHVQRFTINNFLEISELNRFNCIEVTGSSLLAGPFSNMLFTGIKWIMNLNVKLAKKYPKISSGFYFELKKNLH